MTRSSCSAVSFPATEIAPARLSAGRLDMTGDGALVRTADKSEKGKRSERVTVTFRNAVQIYNGLRPRNALHLQLLQPPHFLFVQIVSPNMRSDLLPLERNTCRAIVIRGNTRKAQRQPEAHPVSGPTASTG